MGDCYITRRGGEGLNFDVKAYASEAALPATAKENTIAVITTTAISGYQFSVEQPAAPTSGYVWFAETTSSAVVFSVTKKNPIMVYPRSAKQYVGSTWVDVEARSYQDGAWVDWWDQYIYKNGDEYTNITGGWTVNGVATKEEDCIDLPVVNTNSGRNAGGYTGNKIDLTGINNIKCTFGGSMVCDTGGTAIWIWAAQQQLTDDYQYAAAYKKYTDDGALGDITLDVSSLAGEYYIGFNAFRGGGHGDDDMKNARLYKVKVEG